MRVYKLYLNVYNFTDCNCCLAPIGLGGYHTGIEINNDQYCFYVVSTDPDESGVIKIQPQTAEYQFSHKIYLGEVEMMNYRFDEIVQQLAEEFTVGSYHMFLNNCNHFSRAMAKKLLNQDLPNWIFRSTDFLGAITCCLPTSLMNGQWALQQLLEQQTKKEDDKRLLDEGF